MNVHTLTWHGWILYLLVLSFAVAFDGGKGREGEKEEGDEGGRMETEIVFLRPGIQCIRHVF